MMALAKSTESAKVVVASDGNSGGVRAKLRDNERERREKVGA